MFFKQLCNSIQMVSIRVSDNNAIKVNVMSCHYTIFIQATYYVGEVLCMSTINEIIVLLAYKQMYYVIVIIPNFEDLGSSDPNRMFASNK